MGNIPFHRPYITDDEIEGVIDTLKSGWLTMGPKTIRFEEEFSRYIGSPHAVSVNSCTAALHLALQAIDLKPGDEVVIPTMTFVATGEVICYFQARPVLIDVAGDTGNIDVLKIEEVITPKTKAIIPVHFAGQPCDMDEIGQIARRYGLRVIEDAAHALPAWYKGKKIGTLGDMTCFSFYATKTLSTGEGGMVTTDNDAWADCMARLRLHGIDKDAWKRYSGEGSWYYEVTELGYKYNMTDIQAALGLAQLKKLEWMCERRKKIAEIYTKAFTQSDFIVPPCVLPDRTSAWHLYVIKLDLNALKIDRAQFMQELSRHGVGVSVHFIPLHRHPFYRDSFGYDPSAFPVAECIYERIVSLPIYPGMTDEDASRVADTITAVAHQFRR